MQKVPHEITLFAGCVWADGKISLIDIVETSNKNASKFVRGFLRDDFISHVGTSTPNDGDPIHWRAIPRGKI